MILRAGPLTFNIKRRRRITYEDFTRRYALIRLQGNLESAKRDLEQTPGGRRRRLREKIARLELQIDALRLRIESDG